MKLFEKLFARKENVAVAQTNPNVFNGKEYDPREIEWMNHFKSLLESFHLNYKFVNPGQVEIRNQNRLLCCRVFHNGKELGDSQTVVGLLPKNEEDAKYYTEKGWLRNANSISWAFLPMIDILNKVENPLYTQLYELNVN